MNVSLLIEKAGGVARGTYLGRFGYSRYRLADAVNAGLIRRIRPGVFGTRTAHPDVVAAAAHGGSLTCQRALQIHGVWTLGMDDTIHVRVPPPGRVHHQECSCVTHFSPDGSSLGLVAVDDALVHLFHCGSEEEFFVALESALRLRLLTHVTRAKLRQRVPSRGRWLVDFAREDADSGLESLVRLRLHRLGICVTTQVHIRGVGRVDFVIEGRLILEADGAENHAAPRKRHRDLRRDAVASAQGYETLRFDYALIVHNWPVVEEAILAALSRPH